MSSTAKKQPSKQGATEYDHIPRLLICACVGLKRDPIKQRVGGAVVQYLQIQNVGAHSFRALCYFSCSCKLVTSYLLRRRIAAYFPPTIDPYMPYIIPDGYNSSLNGNTVEFTCELPNETSHFAWLINGKSAFEFGRELLSERGIVSDYVFVREDNRTFTVIGIDPRVENNNTRLNCLAIFSDTAPLISADVNFMIQGRE